jgi:hypothetical protein
MIFLAQHGERVRAAMSLTPAQAEQTVTEYEASRCAKCGVPSELHERTDGRRTCAPCDGGPSTLRFSFCVHHPGHALDQEETIIRARSAEDARRAAEERAAAWGARLQLVGVRDAQRLVLRCPEAELPESWRDEAPAGRAGGMR